MFIYKFTIYWGNTVVALTMESDGECESAEKGKHIKMRLIAWLQNKSYFYNGEKLLPQDWYTGAWVYCIFFKNPDVPPREIHTDILSQFFNGPREILMFLKQ